MIIPKECWSRSRLLEYIHANELDFVARCSSTWHMLGIQAYLYKLQDTLKRPFTGVIMLGSTDGAHYAISEETFRLPEMCTAKFVGSDPETNAEKKQLLVSGLRGKNVRNNDARPLAVVSINRGWHLLAANIDHTKYMPYSVVADEGFSQYNDARQWYLLAYQESRSIRRVLAVMAQDMMIGVLRRKYHTQETMFTLFDKKNGMRRNEKVIAYYRQTAEKEAAATHLPQQSDADLLFLTQPLVGDNHITEEAMISFYDRLAETLRGEKLSIKVHPRDRQAIADSKLADCVVSAPGISAENYFLALKHRPKIIIGFNSTSLLSLKLFGNVRVISLNHLIVQDITSQSLREGFDNFERYFGREIEFPESFEKLHSSVRE